MIKNKKGWIIATSVVCIAVALVVVLTAVIIPGRKKKDFIAAYGQEVFDVVGLVEKGAYISFGTYEQDNDTSNGKEEIEWLVLEVKDGKALIVSKYAIDCKPYNTELVATTWESCTLRSWLNNDFLSAFSSEEKAMISETSLPAGKNPEYDTDPGNETKDKIFLLNITEANQYFSSKSSRKCKATEYAKAQGVSVESKNCYYWLRTPGRNPDTAALDYYGGVCGYGTVNSTNFAVRPALWIDLNS